MSKLLSERGATKEHLEIRHLESIDRVMDAETPEEAELLAKKAEDKIFVTLLHLTARKKIFPQTPAAYRRKADRADGLVLYFENQAKTLGVDEAEKVEKLRIKAEKQRTRASNLREYANHLEAGTPVPPFKEMYAAKDEEDEPDVDVEEAPKEKKPRKPRRPLPVKRLKRTRKK